MHTLNLVGLILGYLGSISLAAGLIKSKQEVIDEERPFWGPNPFKIRSTLSSRMLGLFGLCLLVTGFAISTVATAFSTVFFIDDIAMAVGFIGLLLFIAFSLIAAILQAKRNAHRNAKNRYYFHELLGTVRELSKENQPRGPSDHSHDFATVQKHYIDQVGQYTDDLNAQDRQTLGRLVTSLHEASNFSEIKTILNEFNATYSESEKVK